MQNSNVIKELMKKLKSEIPLVDYQGLELLEYSHRGVEVEMPLKGNRNVHSTAYAGSLASLMIITSWLQVKTVVDHFNIEASIVLQKCELSFRKPVLGDITARTKAPNEIDIRRMAEQMKEGKAKLSIECDVLLDGVVYDHFTGIFHLSSDIKKGRLKR